MNCGKDEAVRIVRNRLDRGGVDVSNVDISATLIKVTADKDIFKIKATKPLSPNVIYRLTVAHGRLIFQHDTESVVLDLQIC